MKKLSNISLCFPYDSKICLCMCKATVIQSIPPPLKKLKLIKFIVYKEHFTKYI